MKRTWVTKNGIKTKTYTTVAGVDARVYKRDVDKSYRLKKRQEREDQKEKGEAPKRKQLYQKINNEDVMEMIRLREVGLSLVKIGKRFGVTRYVADLAIKNYLANATANASTDATATANTDANAMIVNTDAIVNVTIVADQNTHIIDP